MKPVETMSLEELREEVLAWRLLDGLTDDERAEIKLADALGVTPTTARYALVLRAANGRHVTRHALVEEGSRGAAGCDDGASVHVCRLRRVLGWDAITTEWGRGYVLSPIGIARIDTALKGAA